MKVQLVTILLFFVGILSVQAQIKERETSPPPPTRTPSAPSAPSVARAAVDVNWEGSNTVNIVIDGTTYAFRGGQIQRLNLRTNQTLELYVQLPGRKLFADEFLLVDASGGEIRINLQGDKTVFTYETPSEKRLSEQRAAAAEQRAEAARAEEEKLREQRAAAARAEEEKLLSLEIVLVRGGTFTMGCTPVKGRDCHNNEGPAHQVSLTDFHIGKYEVTQAQWLAVMGSNPSKFSGCDSCPVENISWIDVQDFLSKLNSMTGKRYRLPTEAEWEYAARGGNQSRGYVFSGGSTYRSLDGVAWYGYNSDEKTHPVGQKLANELGLYDMSGNVDEWCQDWEGDYSSGSQTNPRGPSSGSYRILRGGSWDSTSIGPRVTHRNYLSPDSDFTGLSKIGFRLAL